MPSARELSPKALARRRVLWYNKGNRSPKKENEMRNPMMPDYMFRAFDEITPAFLASLGVKAILADIDNTLAPYEQPEPDERIKGWIASLAEAGIGIAFVSNNDWERVELFNRTLGVPAYAKSGKPFKKNLVKAMNDLGGTLDTTVMLGDQLLTDALAGHNLGVKCLIVPPIRDKKNAFFKFKRWLEKPVVRRFKRRNGIEW
jgi:HAD superfamily phosphatase (TIGR01668 family)